MKILYDIAFTLFGAVSLPFLLIRGKVGREFIERLGRLPADTAAVKNPVWIHAVSVGEAAVAAKLIREIKTRRPDLKIVVSTTTRTGNDMMLKSARDLIDSIFYYPFDLSFVVSRVIRALRPRLYIMMETELWPNLLHAMRKEGIPVALANGRISDSSYRNYRVIRPVTRRVLSCVTKACVQTPLDAERTRALGAPRESVIVTGNMKFDETAGAGGTSISRDMLGSGPDGLVITAGSTHYPEENQILSVFLRIKRSLPGIKLVLAPRHIERVDAIRTYIEKTGLSYRLFSELEESSGSRRSASADVVLVDTIGHLKSIYGVSDIVFIGGSLARKGGQNLIEAASWGRPVVFGPHMFNFRDASRVFLEKGAAFMAENEESLETVLRELAADGAKRETAGKKALEVIKDSSGAVSRTVDALEELLDGARGRLPGDTAREADR